MRFQTKMYKCGKGLRFKLFLDLNQNENFNPLKMISSPYCAVSLFVLIFVLNSLIRYTSVMAYMKFLSPLLRVVSLHLGMLDELKRRFGITSRFFYSLLLFGKDIWR